MCTLQKPDRRHFLKKSKFKNYIEIAASLAVTIHFGCLAVFSGHPLHFIKKHLDLLACGVPRSFADWSFTAEQPPSSRSVRAAMDPPLPPPPASSSAPPAPAGSSATAAPHASAVSCAFPGPALLGASNTENRVSAVVGQDGQLSLFIQYPPDILALGVKPRPKGSKGTLLSCNWKECVYLLYSSIYFLDPSMVRPSHRNRRSKQIPSSAVF